jgi:hypothetical protein
MFRLVEHKIGSWRAVGIVPPIREEMISHSDFVRPLEETGRDDLVSVDVVHQ